MNHTKYSHAISDEFVIKRCHYGVRLIPQKKLQNAKYPKVVDVMSLPINFYFSDRDCKIRRINQQTALTCGYLSEKDAIGKSVCDVAKRGTAHKIIENDRMIIKTGQRKIIEEHFTRKDGLDLIATSIKLPWYDNDENIIGTFGCSIITNRKPHRLADVFSSLIKINLLTPSIKDKFSLLAKNLGIQLSKNEEILMLWLMRGKTAKEIAKELMLSHRTVEHHVERLKIKFNVSTKSELIEKITDYFI